MSRKFIIPTNFMESGYVLNGTISIRNAIEGVVLGLLGFLLCKVLPIPQGLDGISYYILIVLPLAMIGAYGIQGDPISVFVWDLFKWGRRRKPYFYSNHSEAYTQEAADFLMNAPQLRDYLADALDKVRNSLATEDMDYVEGETFTFAVDPEQEALKSAEEELLLQREEELAKALLGRRPSADPTPEESLLDAENAKESPKVSIGKNIDAQKIAEMLVLDDLEEEG